MENHVNYCKSLRGHGQLAFSLVELLIALFIFSILSTFAFKFINFSTKISKSLTIESTRLSMVNKIFSFLENDLRAAREITFLNEGKSILIKKNNFDDYLPVNEDCIKYEFDGRNLLKRYSLLCKSSESYGKLSQSVLIPNIVDLTFSSSYSEKDHMVDLDVSLASSSFGKVTRLFYVDLSEHSPFILSESFGLSTSSEFPDGALSSMPPQMEQLELQTEQLIPPLQLPPFNQTPIPAPELPIPEPLIPEPIPIMMPLV